MREQSAASPVVSPLLLPTLMLGTFMGALNASLVTPAFTELGRAFAIDVRDLTWVFTLYILGNVAGLSLMAKLSDMYGRRPIYMLCLGLFGLGSLVCLLALDFWMLLAGRAIQAFGASGVIPVATALIGDVYPRERQGAALGLIGTLWGLSAIVGPALGGAILAVLGWRGLFLINLPIAAVLVLLAVRVIPAVRRSVSGRFDFAGLLLLTAALTALVYGLSRLSGDRPWLGLFEPAVGGVLLLALLLGVPWVLVERRAENPIVDLRLFQNRQIRLVYLLSIVGGAMMATRAFVPTTVEVLLGVEPAAAGAIAALVAAVMTVATPLNGLLIDRFGPRLVLLVGSFIAGVGSIWIGVAQQTWVGVIGGFVVSGIGLSATLGTPLRYIVIRETRSSERAIANALQSVMNSIGSSAAFALTGAAVSSAATPVAGYELVFVSFGVLSLVSVLPILRLRGKERGSRPLPTPQHGAA
ncbi:MAG: MFS transporter [Chloroflexota bacterium]|nr:MFS transporter [Dehalococcoidia bacterium]MDW8253620.1 MFS transporter [Chloroflexota bacterium]